MDIMNLIGYGIAFLVLWAIFYGILIYFKRRKENRSPEEKEAEQQNLLKKHNLID